MPFLAREHLPIPTKDILSWYFDDPLYDLDAPLYFDANNVARSYTGNQARTAIRRIAAGLKAAGVKKGDCVCIHSFNDVNYPILVNGIVAAEAIFSGTNPSYTAHELSHAFRTAKISAVIAEPEMLEVALDAASTAGIPQSRVWAFDNLGQPKESFRGCKSWGTLMDHGETDWPRFDDLETSKNTTVGRLFSSGTTGLPKAAVLSHYNFVAQHVFINEWRAKPYKQRRLTPLPLFHVAVVPAVHFSPLRNGVPTFIMRRFELEPWLQNIEKHDITDLTLVPPMVIAVIMSPVTKNYSLKSIKAAICGAAALEKGLQARLQALLAEGVPFCQIWGMTEMTSIATLFPYPETDTTGSIGRPAPDLDMKLVDDEGKDITAHGVRGEMCVRGPTVINGYLDNPDANSRDWDADGFFHTGDIGYCEEGTENWYIVDRKKELIKVRGFQVAPPELEGVILSHPDVVDCAVIGVKPDAAHQRKDDTELPRAYVVARPDAARKPTERDIYDLVKGRLAAFKRLDGGIRFVESIPKNPSGKILKRVLRDEAEKESGAAHKAKI